LKSVLQEPFFSFSYVSLLILQKSRESVNFQQNSNHQPEELPEKDKLFMQISLATLKMFYSNEARFVSLPTTFCENLKVL
jgi:hypothetical protein